MGKNPRKWSGDGKITAVRKLHFSMTLSVDECTCCKCLL